MPADVHGILLLDKPLGMTSAGAVARVKQMFGARKAGHTGSLDPLAGGLLPICFGEATKFGARLLDADKTYLVTARLGERTPSGDLETPVIERRDVPQLSVAQIEAALAGFPRDYLQMPPMHSAIKQDGTPLYVFARAGIIRERAPRAIVIREMRLVEWRAPDLRFVVRCSKGAYMRVLAEDLAGRVGTVAHLAALRRLGVAPFGTTEAPYTLETLQALAPDARLGVLLPVDAALAACRRLDLPPEGVAAVRRGQSVSLPVEAPGTVRIYAAGLGFLGLGEVEAAGRLVPLRLVSAAANQA